MGTKPIAGNEDEYIRILIQRNEQLAARIEKAASIYRKQKRDNKELQNKIEELQKIIEEYEEMVLLYY